MVSLVARLELPPQDEIRPRWLIATGAAGAALGAAVGMAVLSAVTVLLWAAGPLAGSGITAAPFRGAAAIWLFAQRAPLDNGTSELVLPPFAVAVGVVAVSIRVAAWAARRTRAHDLGSAATVAAGVVLGHVSLAAAAAAFSSGGGSGVDPLDALRAGVILAVPCALAGVAPQTWLWAHLAARYSTPVRVAARAAGAGVAVLLGGAAAVLLASLAMHHAALVELFDAIGGGISGGVGTTLLCLAMAPNAVLWVVSFAAGPGFALGTDAGLDLGGLHDGALPAMPLLAALPAAGPLPGIAYVAIAVPAAAGAAIGWFARPSGAARNPRVELVVAALAALACGLGTAVLAGLSGGGAGGRLSSLGPSTLALALALVPELVVVAVVVAAGRLGYERVRGVAVPTTPAVRIPRQKSKPVGEEPGESATDATAAGGTDQEGDLEDIENTQEIPVISDDDDEPASS